MAIRPKSPEPVGLAIFAKAPQAGMAKTRLIPALGAGGAARLQRQLTLQALALAAQAVAAGDIDPPTLWVAPDASHRFFRSLQRCRGSIVRSQQGPDLGQRMATAFAAQAGPLLLIGSDCPALRPAHLAACARALRNGDDAVFIPAEDGGYVLAGLRRPQPRLFEGIDWGGAQVMRQTRHKLRELGLRWTEPATLWDVDRPDDLARLSTLAGFAAWP